MKDLTLYSRLYTRENKVIRECSFSNDVEIQTEKGIIKIHGTIFLNEEDFRSSFFNGTVITKEKDQNIPVWTLEEHSYIVPMIEFFSVVCIIKEKKMQYSKLFVSEAEAAEYFFKQNPQDFTSVQLFRHRFSGGFDVENGLVCTAAKKQQYVYGSSVFLDDIPYFQNNIRESRMTAFLREQKKCGKRCRQDMIENIQYLQSSFLSFLSRKTGISPSCMKFDSHSASLLRLPVNSSLIPVTFLAEDLRGDKLNAVMKDDKWKLLWPNQIKKDNRLLMEFQKENYCQPSEFCIFSL